jgi:hypothetical protein
MLRMQKSARTGNVDMWTTSFAQEEEDESAIDELGMILFYSFKITHFQ